MTIDIAEVAKAHAIKRTIVVDGIELTVTQTGNYVSIHKVIARDRKRKLDITRGTQFSLDDLAAITLVEKLKRVADYQTAVCTCDYRAGYSDYAEHCRSIQIAQYNGACLDDD